MPNHAKRGMASRIILGGLLNVALADSPTGVGPASPATRHTPTPPPSGREWPQGYAPAPGQAQHASRGSRRPLRPYSPCPGRGGCTADGAPCNGHHHGWGWLIPLAALAVSVAATWGRCACLDQAGTPARRSWPSRPPLDPTIAAPIALISGGSLLLLVAWSGPPCQGPHLPNLGPRGLPPTVADSLSAAAPDGFQVDMHLPYIIAALSAATSAMCGVTCGSIFLTAAISLAWTACRSLASSIADRWASASLQQHTRLGRCITACCPKRITRIVLSDVPASARSSDSSASLVAHARGEGVSPAHSRSPRSRGGAGALPAAAVGRPYSPPAIRLEDGGRTGQPPVPIGAIGARRTLPLTSKAAFCPIFGVIKMRIPSKNWEKSMSQSSPTAVKRIPISMFAFEKTDVNMNLAGSFLCKS